MDIDFKIMYADPVLNRVNFKSVADKEACLKGDFLINSYITKLDEEIFSVAPEGAGDEWYVDSLYIMCTQMVDKARLHGWSVVQFYNTSPFWRVFSEPDKVDWICDDQNQVIGVKVAYGTETKEDLMFGVNQCYLFKFKEGDNKGGMFAEPDLNQAMWTIATVVREIQFQLDSMCRKPEFYHIVYGSPNVNERTSVRNALDNVNSINSFAASENVVKEIRVIKRETFGELQDVIADKIRNFSGLTRLPLAFYNGERTSGSGTGGAAENMVEIKIIRRKDALVNLFLPTIKKIYKERYNKDIKGFNYGQSIKRIDSST